MSDPATTPAAAQDPKDAQRDRELAVEIATHRARALAAVLSDYFVRESASAGSGHAHQEEFWDGMHYIAEQIKDDLRVIEGGAQ